MLSRRHEFSVYALVDPTTNEVRYIGKARDPQQRFAGHLKDTKPSHKRNWIKSLADNGHKPVLEIIADGLTEAQAFRLERVEIAARDNLTNMTEGGEGQTGVMPEHVKAKISESLKGTKATPEQIAKRSASLKEFYASPEGKRVLARIGKKARGRAVSDETRRKISESKRGVAIPEDVRAKIRASVSASRMGIEPWNKGKKTGIKRPDLAAMNKARAEARRIARDAQIAQETIDSVGNITTYLHNAEGRFEAPDDVSPL